MTENSYKWQNIITSTTNKYFNCHQSYLLLFLHLMDSSLLIFLNYVAIPSPTCSKFRHFLSIRPHFLQSWTMTWLETLPMNNWPTTEPKVHANHTALIWLVFWKTWRNPCATMQLHSEATVFTTKLPKIRPWRKFGPQFNDTRCLFVCGRCILSNHDFYKRQYRRGFPKHHNYLRSRNNKSKQADLIRRISRMSFVIDDFLII